jgi:H+/gluconate symporter-like permease
MILLLGIYSNPIMLILLSLLFTIPVFFFVLLGRELID